MIASVKTLLKKEAREFFSELKGPRKTSDIPGKLLSLLLAVAIVVVACFVLKRFGTMYVGIEINRVPDPYGRLWELTSAIYLLIIFVNPAVACSHNDIIFPEYRMLLQLFRKCLCAVHPV